MDQAGWAAWSYSGDLYSRNTNDGDNTIVRQNDGSFSYSIPHDTEKVILTVRARTNSGNLFQMGFYDSVTSSPLFGLGSGYNSGSNQSKYFIFDYGTRIFETGDSIVGDSMVTLELEIDMINSLATLSVDGTPLVSNHSSARIADIPDTSAIFIRTASRYTGAAEFSITTVPEPGTAGLFAIGLLGLARAFRRKN